MTEQTVAPKILVAVHGIGDQTKFATAQSVAFRLFEYYRQPPALPLGRFYPDPSSPGAILLREDDPQLPGTIGFAEVYWADIPRRLVEKRYTIEEAKSWARSIVARLTLRARAAADGGGPTMRDYAMLDIVLEEMLDAIFLLENLTFLAGKAGIFQFGLKKLLDDYLNDVQIVTEFGGYRREIVDTFSSLMHDIAENKATPGAEIYLVAHSEGSVVAFYSLLQALSQVPPPPWIQQVRGLMTIGSPIETHVILWEELWRRLRPPKQEPERRIPWWNYFDSGDPIAYRLERTRAWMRQTHWDRFFEHDRTHDVEFARYPMPGKAHVDYWKDAAVFDHFIENVVKPQPVQEPVRTASELPRSLGWVALVSATFPYVLVVALMFLSSFCLYKPMNAALTQGGQPTPAWEMFKNTLGFTWLMAGMTAVVRIPRLTRFGLWWAAGALVLATGVWAFPSLVGGASGNAVRDALDRLIPDIGLAADKGNVPFLTIVVIATVVSAMWSHWRPARGVLPLLVPAGAVSAFLVVSLLLRAREGSIDANLAIWPIVVGAVVFLYVWWLATLLLDLTVIWHAYVRWGTAVTIMRDMVKPDSRAQSGGPVKQRSQADAPV